MGNLRMTLLDLVNKMSRAPNPALRDGVRLLAQELMDAEVSQLAGAGLDDRSENRLTYRKGYRERERDTRAGTLSSRSPSCVKGPTSRACSSRAGATSGHCSCWSRRPTCRESRPGLSTRDLPTAADDTGTLLAKPTPLIRSDP